MPMGIAETLAAIQAAMQGIDLFLKLGDRYSGFQTLGLQADPTPYLPLEREILRRDPTGKLGYDKVFATVGMRTEKCMKSLVRGLEDDDLLPDERERLGRQARRCVCREIKVVLDFIQREQIPADLLDQWSFHGCAEFYPNLAHISKAHQ